jgi:hypothetical protein
LMMPTRMAMEIGSLSTSTPSQSKISRSGVTDLPGMC